MASLQSLSARILAACTLLGVASAQQITFPNPTTFAGSGAEAVIASDEDGGGVRDVVVSTIDPATAQAQIDLFSSETGTSLGAFNFAPDIGRALANIGDVDGVPGDEIAATSPANNLLFIFSGALPFNVL